MLKLLEQWLDKHELRDEDGRLKDALWVTDGVRLRGSLGVLSSRAALGSSVR